MPDRRTAKASELPPIDLNPRRDPPLDFPDREFGELSPQDYRELGFLCGLEVHQQLDTARKLFCRCPAGVRTTRTDASILRHMRPTLSEMGDYDGCALMEFKTRKEIVYLLERGTACTYEMDDTPPFEIDEAAVRIALWVSRLFDLQLVSELQVMRKQYLDGSIPTGFQRTAMVGIGGAIGFRGSELGSDRQLRIRQLTLEEDSCREVSDVGHRITFRTDRLGTPLIETVTEPDMWTPQEVAVGGRLLADVAHVSRRLCRGAGAGRQDVNVSIAGSRRVEIKGTSQHRHLPRLVHIEAYRHLNLLRIQDELEKRGVDAAALSNVQELHLDVSSLLEGSNYGPVDEALRAGQRVRAVRLPGFAGLLARKTQPGIAFAQEFSERARVIACLTGRPFMLARDVAGERLGESTWGEIQKALGADEDDSVVLVWGDKEDAETAATEVVLRADQAFRGVPSETRQPHPDGTTGFERILPGPERMYPDTDTPQLPIPDAWVTEIDSKRWELPWQRSDRYEETGLTSAVAHRLAVAPWADLFDELAPEDPAIARRIAHALELRLPHFWREVGHRELPQVERLRPLVEALASERVHPSGAMWILDRLLREPGEPGDIIGEHEIAEGDVASRRVDMWFATRKEHREGMIKYLRDAGSEFEWPSAPWPFADADSRLRNAMGEILRGRSRGNVDPRQVRDMLEQRFAEEGE